MDLSRLYQPVTAMPFQNDRLYHEQFPRHALLKPWVRCFWRGVSSAHPADPHPVVPDTCTDIIFRTSVLNGQSVAGYCALNDRVFFSADPRPARVDLFGIRFYPWAAPLWMQDTLRGSLNLSFDARWHFPTLAGALEKTLEKKRDFANRCLLAEEVLLTYMQPDRLNPTFLNAIADILQNEGRMRISALAAHQQVNERQLERLFQEYIGSSPKKLNDLIRYQYLWQSALSPVFNVQDAVFQFGYADQSHLLRQFRRYHGMTLTQAVGYAHSHVGFVQYNPSIR